MDKTTPSIIYRQDELNDIILNLMHMDERKFHLVCHFAWSLAHPDIAHKIMEAREAEKRRAKK